MRQERFDGRQLVSRSGSQAGIPSLQAFRGLITAQVLANRNFSKGSNLAWSHFAFLRRASLVQPGRAWSFLPVISREPSQGERGKKWSGPRLPPSPRPVNLFFFASSRHSAHRILPRPANETKTPFTGCFKTPPSSNHGPISVCAVRHHAYYHPPGPLFLASPTATRSALRIHSPLGGTGRPRDSGKRQHTFRRRRQPTRDEQPRLRRDART